MPRRNSRAPSSPPPSSGRAVGERIEAFGGEPYRVRSLRSGGDGGPYRCPGCDQEVAAGTAHVVAWPAADPQARDRRHWHSACWTRRETARPAPSRRPRR